MAAEYAKIRHSKETTDTDTDTAAAGVTASAITVEDLYAYLPAHQYLFVPTRELWPGASVDSRLPALMGADGKSVRPTAWLDVNRSVEQMTWAPGFPMIIADKLVSEGGWMQFPVAKALRKKPPSPPATPSTAATPSTPAARDSLAAK